MRETNLKLILKSLRLKMAFIDIELINVSDESLQTRIELHGRWFKLFNGVSRARDLLEREENEPEREENEYVKMNSFYG